MSRDKLPPLPAQSLRSALVACGFVLLTGLLLARLHSVQVEDAHLYAEIDRSQRVRTNNIPAPRGRIFAADSTPLVADIASYDCIADPLIMKDKLRAIVEIARITGQDREEIRKHFESGRNGRRIATAITEEQADAIRALKIDHIVIRPSYKRNYVMGSLASHVIGFSNSHADGLSGIELALDVHLRGIPGEQRYYADARGRFSSLPDDIQKPQAGASVELTLIPAIQQRLDMALAECAEEHNPKSIAGIVVRPRTGEILAMSSWPTFDANKYTEVPLSYHYNQVTGFVYESGSTVKPLIAGAAVEQGLVNWSTRIDCEDGSWTARVGRSKRTIGSHPHGVLSVRDGVAKSDNILMAKLAIKMGAESMEGWLRKFGFAGRTGILLPGEQRGIFPRKWSVINEGISASFGHGFSITPLQVAMAHAAVANGGMWQPPRLVRRIFRTDPISGQQEELPVPALPLAHRMFNESTADGIESSMRAVMEDGTGTKLQLDGFSSAGKTGTTDVLVNGRYLDKGGPHIGSFVGWAPAQSQQIAEVLCLVVVNEPREADGSPREYPHYFGSKTGGPVAQKVLQFSLEYLGVANDQ